MLLDPHLPHQRFRLPLGWLQVNLFLNPYPKPETLDPISQRPDLKTEISNSSLTMKAFGVCDAKLTRFCVSIVVVLLGFFLGGGFSSPTPPNTSLGPLPHAHPYFIPVPTPDYPPRVLSQYNLSAQLHACFVYIYVYVHVHFIFIYLHICLVLYFYYTSYNNYMYIYYIYRSNTQGASWVEWNGMCVYACMYVVSVIVCCECASCHVRMWKYSM